MYITAKFKKKMQIKLYKIGIILVYTAAFYQKIKWEKIEPKNWGWWICPERMKFGGSYTN